MIKFRQAARAAAAALCVAMLAGTAMAAPSEVKFTGSSGGFFKMRKQIAVPAYQVTFITQQEATAVSSIAARTRLNTVLTGVDEATMKRLTNEAHADLIAQFTAAGITPLSDAQAATIAAGAEKVPGNSDVKEAGGGITIGKAVRKGYASYGADAAPLLKAYHNPGSATGAVGFASMGANSAVGKAGKDVDAVALIPSLVFDYIDMEAKTGLGKASASGDVQFSLRSMASSATLVGAGNAGPGYAQGWRLVKDVVTPGNFAKAEEGGADVRVGSMTDTTDKNYQKVARARGDAVVVDLPVWEGMVRETFKAYNAAIVAAVLKDRG